MKKYFHMLKSGSIFPKGAHMPTTNFYFNGIEAKIPETILFAGAAILPLSSRLEETSYPLDVSGDELVQILRIPPHLRGKTVYETISDNRRPSAPLPSELVEKFKDISPSKYQVPRDEGENVPEYRLARLQVPTKAAFAIIVNRGFREQAYSFISEQKLPPELRKFPFQEDATENGLLALSRMPSLKGSSPQPGMAQNAGWRHTAALIARRTLLTASAATAGLFFYICKTENVFELAKQVVMDQDTNAEHIRTLVKSTEAFDLAKYINGNGDPDARQDPIRGYVATMFRSFVEVGTQKRVDDMEFAANPGYFLTQPSQTQRLFPVVNLAAINTSLNGVEKDDDGEPLRALQTIAGNFYLSLQGKLRGRDVITAKILQDSLNDGIMAALNDRSLDDDIILRVLNGLADPGTGLMQLVGKMIDYHRNFITQNLAPADPEPTHRRGNPSPSPRGAG
jgi:hypothetical protein